MVYSVGLSGLLSMTLEYIRGLKVETRCGKPSWKKVYSGHLSGSLSMNFEYIHSSKVETRQGVKNPTGNGLLCWLKWFA